MAGLSVLLRVYEASGGRIGQGVDAKASATDLSNLATRGLVIMGPKGEASLTGEGLRHLFEGLARLARESPPVPAQGLGRADDASPAGGSHDELTLEEIGLLAGIRTDGLALARNVVPLASAAKTPERPQDEAAPISVVRSEVDRLVRELLASGGLGTDGFGDKLSRAHDLQQAVLAIEDQLTSKLKPRKL